MAGGKGKIRPEDGKQFSSEYQPESNGRPKKLPELDLLMAAVLGSENGEVDTSKAKEIVEAMYKKALKGDVNAANFLMNRGYGLPTQPIDFKGDITLKTNTYTLPDGTTLEI